MAQSVLAFSAPNLTARKPAAVLALFIERLARSDGVVPPSAPRILADFNLAAPD